MQKVLLTIIDPDNDFMDGSASALPVHGARSDMKRIGASIVCHGDMIDKIVVFLDKHRKLHVAHPTMWKGRRGVYPHPHSEIGFDEVVNRVWVPRDGKESSYNRALSYTRLLEENGGYKLHIWPEHCLDKTWGSDIYAPLKKALRKWKSVHGREFKIISKPDLVWQEYFGVLEPQVMLPQDSNLPQILEYERIINGYIKKIIESDIALFCGEALTHCFIISILQIMKRIDPKHYLKIHILLDATSPIQKVGDGPDFPAIVQGQLAEIQSKGVVLTTTTEFFSKRR